MGLAIKTIRSAAVCLVVLLVGTRGLYADEPAARFLEALRDKGYYDIALEYLDKAKDDPNVPSSFRKRINYEKASILVDQSNQLRDRKEKDAQLDLAQKLLTQYAANSSSLVEAVRSLSFEGLLLSKRADFLLNDAEASQLTESERQALRTQARGYLEKSNEKVKETLEIAEQLLDRDPSNSEALKISADDPQSRILVKEMRGKHQIMTVQLPLNVERIASTYPKLHPKRQEALQAAAQRYKEICEGSYGNSVPGVQACLRAGLCYQQLGNDKEALDFLKQVMSSPRLPSIDSLQKKAFAAAGDSWEKIDPYPARSAISQLQPVIENLSRSESRDPAWLRARLELGIAKYKMSEIVKEAGGPNAATKSKSIKREAGRLVRDVTRVNNPFRDRARALLGKWKIPLIEIEDPEEDAPAGAANSFAAAFEVGRDKIPSIELLYGELARARNAAKSAPPAKQEELAVKVSEMEAQLQEQADQALAAFDLALSMADRNTSADEINACRLNQTFCYFVTNRHLEVAIIAQYLLEKHPDDMGTKGAVGLLLGSRSALYAAVPKEDNQAELRSLKNTALEIARRWPGTNEAGSAISKLIQITLRDGDLPQAVELMDRLPKDSAQRPTLTAQVGQRLWNSYQQDSRDPVLRINTNEMNKKLEQAVRFLKISESLVKPDSITFNDAVTGFNLVDAMLAAKQPEEALALLESSPLSPLQIIKSQNAAVFGNSKADQFKSRAYSVIIKTYLAKLETAQNQQIWIDKANGVIELMRQEAKASGSDAAKQQLTAIYNLISAELRKRFKNTNNPEQKIQLARASTDFLVELEKTSNSSRVLLNSGSALMSMATDLSEGEMKDKAKVFFVQASKTLAKAEAIGFKGDKDAIKLNLKLKRQQALALRGAGKYEQAVASFTSLLQKSNRSLSMQLDAAATLQQWGKSARLSKKLAQAVNGTGKFTDPKTKRPAKAIWGWNNIARRTQGDKPKYREEYFTAAYGIAEAIYEQGKAKGTDASKRALAQIKKERAKTPDFLGSTVWQDKFSDLEKRIKNGG